MNILRALYTFLVLGACFSHLPLSGQSCSVVGAVEPSSIRFERTITQSRFVGFTEFVQSGELPKYYREIAYSGAWMSDVYHADWALTCDGLVYGRPPAGAQFVGSAIRSLETGSLVQTGTATASIGGIQKSLSSKTLSGFFPGTGSGYSQLQVMPLEIESQTPTYREYSKLPQATACGDYVISQGNATNWQAKGFLESEVTLELLQQDTLEDALKNYATRGGSQEFDTANDAYYNRSSSSPENIYYSEFDLIAEFEFDNCTTKTATVHVTTRTYDHDTQTYAWLPPEAFPLSIDADGRAEFRQTFKSEEEGTRISVVDVYATQNSVCDIGGNPNNSGGSVGSIHWYASLGRLYEDRSVGQIRIDEGDWSDLSFSPADLRLSAAVESNLSVVKDSNGRLRQILSRGDIIDIVTVSSDSYRVDYHEIAAADTPDPITGIYSIVGSSIPHTSYLFEKVPAVTAGVNVNRLRVTQSINGNTVDLTQFEYVEYIANTGRVGTKNWTVWRGYAELKEVISEDSTFYSRPPELSSIDYTLLRKETTSVRNSANEVLSKVDRIYHKVGIGSGYAIGLGNAPSVTYEALRLESFYTGSESTPEYTISYTYGETAGASDYGRLILTVDSRGDWERRSYYSNGQLYQIERSYLGSSQSSPSNLNRLVTYTYTQLADLDGDGVEESLETRTESLLGEDVSRSFELELSGTQTINAVTVKEERFIEAITPSADWDNTDNLVTSVWNYADSDSEFYLEEYARSRPNGTGSITHMMRNQDDSITITESSGTLDSLTAPTTVTAGQITTKWLDLTGVVLTESTVDVESGITIATAHYSNFDHYGRAQRIDYLDGSYETRQYDCCGLQSITGRDGLTTTFGYDALKRIQDTTTAVGTPAEQVERKLRDAAGNLKSHWIGPDLASLEPVAEYDYDFRGQLTASRVRYLDADPTSSRQTDIVETHGSGYIVTTTTQPNGSTYIEKRYPDGSLYELSGTGTRHMRSDYGVELDATLGYAVRTQTDRYIQSDGSLSDEYIKVYRDALGRTYRSEQPAADGTTAVTTSTYYANGQLKSTSDADGQTYLYAYNAEGEQEVTALDVNDNDQIDYNGNDRISRTRRAVTTRDADGQSVVVARQTTELWEADGQDTPSILASADTSLATIPGGIGTLQWITQYDQTTTVQSLIDRATSTVTTTTTLPDTSYAVEVSQNGLLQSRTRYHSNGSILSQQILSYDPLDENRLDTVTDLYRGTTQYNYYGDGQLESLTTPDPDDSRSGSGYDSQTTSFAYTDDATSISRSTTLPDLTTRSEVYYPTGELKELSGSQTYPVAYAYDHAGRLQTLSTWQDKAGSSGQALTGWQYYANGQLKQKWYDATLASNGTFSGTSGPSYTYSPAGRLETKTNARGDTATYAYAVHSLDSTGVSYDDGLTPAVSYSNFDRLGRPHSVTDASGTRELDYQEGRLLDETYTAGLLTDYSIDRRLDSLNRMNQLKLKAGSRVLHQLDYTFDAASRLQRVSHGQHSVSYTYTPASDLRQSKTFNNGSSNILTVDHRLDNLNRLTSISTAHATGTDSYAYRYNELNQRERMTTADNSFWTYQYDDLGQLSSAVQKNPSEIIYPGRSYSYSFDDIGNRTEITTNGRTATYTPNALNEYEERQIPRALDVSGSANSAATVTVNGNATTRLGDYFYRELDLSAAGNSAQQTSVIATGTLPDGGDNNAARVADAEKSEYLPPNPEDFTHDADGNLTQDGRWQYTWDAENRLVEMKTLPIAYSAGAPRQKLEFGYDSQGRRFSKKVYDWDSPSSSFLLSSSFLYLYDGWNLIAELKSLQTSPFTLHSSYTWGIDLSGSMQGAGGVGGLLAVTDAMGSVAYPAYDGNGNITGYYDAANGLSVAEFEYGPFGELMRETYSSPSLSEVEGAGLFNFRFSTKYQDAETGLVYYGFRYYDTETGRWLSRDPIEEAGGLNLYAFGPNSPVNGYDPNGEFWHMVAGAVIGAGLDVGMQLAFGDGPIDWGSVGVSAASGAVGAGIGAKLAHLGKLARIGAVTGTELWIGAGEQLLRNGLDPCADWHEDLIEAALLNALIGNAADYGGNAFARWLKNIPSRATNAPVSQITRSNRTGNAFDDYVAATKLKNLDEAGLLGRQERLPTPDISGTYIKPDYTIWNSRGTVSAYGDAKVLQNGVIKFDSQAKGLVEWATTSESKKLIYYVPWETQAPTNLLNYAAQRGVSIQTVIVP